MRRMYHRCKLVHADLSEYNILYHDGHLYVIDVSQSVEHDHPHAFDFLRNDIQNVEEFFGRFGVQCLGLRRCFEFITKDRLEEEDHEGDILERWIAEAGESAEDLARGAAEVDHTGNAKNHEDSVFMRSYIPRTLNEVYDPERDIDVLKGGEGNKLIYAHTIELVEDASTESGESEVEETEQGPERREPRGHRHEDREAKKVRRTCRGG